MAIQFLLKITLLKKLYEFVIQSPGCIFHSNFNFAIFQLPVILGKEKAFNRFHGYNSEGHKSQHACNTD